MDIPLIIMTAVAVGSGVAASFALRHRHTVGTRCPHCEHRLPFFRLPNSMRQMLLGGWTCPQCGCELDRCARCVEER